MIRSKEKSTITTPAKELPKKNAGESMKSQFNFQPFFQEMAAAGLRHPSQEFCAWFLGFTEGDGCFSVIQKYKKYAFVISQSIEECQVLEEIKKEFSFGRVIAQGVRTCKYVVQDRKGCALLISLFNGNLISPRCKAQFARWMGCGFPEMELQDSHPRPTLRNSWISGLTDSEGSFTASFLSNSNAFRLRFILSQKGSENLPILSTFIRLFSGGVIQAHSQKGSYSYILSGVAHCRNIYPYFSRFPLRTRKKSSFLLWRSLQLDISRKLHLQPQLRALLIEKAKKINSIRRKSK